MPGVLRIEGRVERLKRCLDCGQEFPHIQGYVLDEEGAFAVYFGSCHTAETDAARLDVTLGTWGGDPPVDDHVTFSCELRPSGAEALDAPLTLNDSPPLLGVMLSREQALAHQRIGDFWSVVDAVSEQDPLVASTVYGQP